MLNKFKMWANDLSPFKNAWLVANVVTILICSFVIIGGMIVSLVSSVSMSIIFISCGGVMIIVNVIVTPMAWIISKIF
jgi:hypothetical protein